MDSYPLFLVHSVVDLLSIALRDIVLSWHNKAIYPALVLFMPECIYVYVLGGYNTVVSLTHSQCSSFNVEAEQNKSAPQLGCISHFNLRTRFLASTYSEH